MRSDQGSFQFRQDERYVAVDLPFATKNYSLVVVSTKDQPAPAKDFVGVAKWCTGAGFTKLPGEVALPRLDISANIDLMPMLLTLGLKPPSTLPGFAAGPLQLAKVQQRVELKVDEEGAEAAAATAAIGSRAMEVGLVKMIADKPFIFALRDAASGLIIVAGYVANPV